MARKQTARQKAGTDSASIPGVDDLVPHEAPKPARRDAARVVALLVVLAAIVVFLVQNYGGVPVHFLVFKPRIGLDWLILGSLVVGLAVGLLFARQRRRARAAAEKPERR